MSIVTISRGSRFEGLRVAEKVAKLLGYECLDRQFLVEASERFNIPETKLNKALETVPGFLDRLTFEKDEYVTYIRNALLERLACDNVVYHGFAGQFFLHDVSHVLKVRIISTIEHRIEDLMKRENVTKKEAALAIKKVDDARKKWSLHFYGIDIEDPLSYDLVININNFNADEATELIVNTTRTPRFQSTAVSKGEFDDLLLASRAQTIIMKSFPKANVTAKDGVVMVTYEGVLGMESSYDVKIRDALQGVEGVQQVVSKVWPIADQY